MNPRGGRVSGVLIVHGLVLISLALPFGGRAAAQSTGQFRVSTAVDNIGADSTYQGATGRLIAAYTLDDAEASGLAAPLAGEWFANPDLARTMQAIADEGPGLLYGGALGRTIAQHVQKRGGFLTIEDFAQHTSEWVEPLSVPFKDCRVWELPPNGQGIAVLEMLRLLESHDLAAMGHNSAAYLHHLIEAKKLAYADLEHFVGIRRS